MARTYGSLFAGAGGFDMGFDNAGWECQWQVENHPICSDILQRHWSDIPHYGDIREISGHELQPVDAILFGFPCQDVSKGQPIRRRVGMAGENTSLFFEAARIIQEMRDATDNAYPRYAVAENVAGILSAESGRTFLRVLETLVDLGAMAIEWRVLDAQNFGIPQRRRRVFLVAHFDGRSESGGLVFPQPKSLSRHSAENARPPGGPAVADEDDAGGYRFFVRSSHRRYIEDQCSHTLVASQFGRDATLVHREIGGSSTIRRLTPLEYERLQGWPDFHTKFRYDGTIIADKPRYRIIGNGIAVPCAQWVAQRIADYDSLEAP